MPFGVMSLRTALILTMVLLGLLATVLVGAIGVYGISRNVVAAAQRRVDHDLAVLTAHYEQRLADLAGRLAARAGEVQPASVDPALLSRLRAELDLTVLNVCGPDGAPVAGAYGDPNAAVPIRADPVLRRALLGETATGTVVLDAERLRQEGGSALANALTIRPGKGNAGVDQSLLWWVAVPLKDRAGRTVALLYGGKALNHNYVLVDRFRDLLFGREAHGGKPLGTVTVFLGGVRVATNVVDANRRRAVGTTVSRQVRGRVLDEGQRWSDRAWVVDAWYLSGYEPLRDPDGRIVGMLYVGLLEAPYVDLRTRWIVRFLLPVAVVAVLAVVAALLIVRRITRPLRVLAEASDRMAGGDWQATPPSGSSYREVTRLTEAFEGMRQAIADRDRRLQDRNRELGEANEQLTRVNRNYMEMLGFITHELKSPLAAIQGMADLVVGGYTGEVNEKTAHCLTRIKRNCEELQDMVKNYLDLSRAERGELTAERTDVDFRAEVVDPAVTQTQPLYDSRGITLDVDCPQPLPARADPELMRIALVNYLSNAAKYGAEGGRAELTVRVEDDRIVVSVWNEGPGFTLEEGKKLFEKFGRIRNANTRSKRGSGLGLFLCKQVLAQHNGQVEAASEPGAWARFSFTFPGSNGPGPGRMNGTRAAGGGAGLRAIRDRPD